MAETESLQCQRPEELERDLQNLEGRDLQLWCLGGFISMVLATGFLVLLLPHLFWNLGAIVTKERNLPALFFGLQALLVAAWHLHVPAKKAAADHQAGSDQASPSSGESGAHRCFDRTIQPPNP